MILVTHIDLDGIGCEIVTRYFHPTLKSSDVYHCNYNNVEPAVRKLLSSTTDSILMTDISFGKELADYIEAGYRDRFQLYDHHKTAQELLTAYSWAFLDTTRSATKIIFDIFSARNPSVPITSGLGQLVFLINDYDLWLHTSPDSSNLNGMFSLLGKEVFKDLIWERIQQNQPLITNLDRCYLQGLENYKVRYFSDRIKYAKRIGNRMVLIASNYLSELSQYIRDISPPPEEWKNIDYIDILNFESSTHALRSYNPDFDVSEVAKSKGGGGHPRAAGYPMNIPEKIANTWFEHF